LPGFLHLIRQDKQAGADQVLANADYRREGALELGLGSLLVFGCVVLLVRIFVLALALVGILRDHFRGNSLPLLFFLLVLVFNLFSIIYIYSHQALPLPLGLALGLVLFLYFTLSHNAFSKEG